ncbi:sulfurtransferase FdhD [Halomonas cupida]|uniref:FdhD protein n=1 Tax=Halomonas cupida TaxID=44933 RepID=A0A1M7AVE5_9GAMM|nr:formate dehydrogenase accessory sulfurtransferase FdhD [Halomonas cupida]GEN22243.1 sulfurtransferase FdhD [Halomonas cupida]SHL46675.1 FdhD protein [Halomonas cupida]
MAEPPACIDGWSAGYVDLTGQALRDHQGPTELPVSLALNDTAMGTLLATPDVLEPLALGHAFSEGWIQHRSQVTDIRLSRLRHGLAVRLEVPPSVVRQAEPHRRVETSVSSCGACGANEEAQLFSGLKRLGPQPALAASVIESAVARLASMRCPGLHVAVGVSEQGDLLSCGHDIGRHNALDRVIGHSLDSGIWPAAIVISSRCSVELVQKTVHAGIATLVTLAVPSRLALEVARACDLNLVCANRGHQLELLSGQLP